MKYPRSTTKSQDEAGDRLGLIGERQPWWQTSWPHVADRSRRGIKLGIQHR
jgi:hypothetical protein